VRSAARAPGATVPGRTWPAAITLFLGAGLIPETIATFSSPPFLLLTQPAVFLFISAFYGSVALLVREFLRIRPAGWTAVLLLGMAAGSANEGIIAGTWYKVQYSGYALIGGVDPAVAVGLTIFHTLVSTIVPIFLIEIVFPRAAGRRWLPRPAVAGLMAVLAVTIATGFGPVADRPQKAVVLIAVLAAVAVALSLPALSLPARSLQPPSLPARSSPDGSRPWPALASAADGDSSTADDPAVAGPAGAGVPSAGRLRLAGAGATAGFFVLFAIVPGMLAAAVGPRDLRPWQLLLIALMTGYFSLVIWAGRRWCTRPEWGSRQALAVITGALLPAIAASLVVPAALRGLEPLVTLPALGVLIWLARARAGSRQVTATR
jgi:hypothetical protein